MTFEISDPEDDSQDNEPLLRGAQGYEGIDALVTEMDDDQESDDDDEELDASIQWETDTDRVNRVWTTWAGVPNWAGGDNDLEVDIM